MVFLSHSMISFSILTFCSSLCEFNENDSLRFHHIMLLLVILKSMQLREIECEHFFKN